MIILYQGRSGINRSSKSRLIVGLFMLRFQLSAYNWKIGAYLAEWPKLLFKMIRTYALKSRLYMKVYGWIKVRCYSLFSLHWRKNDEKVELNLFTLLFPMVASQKGGSRPNRSLCVCRFLSWIAVSRHHLWGCDVFSLANSGQLCKYKSCIQYSRAYMNCSWAVLWA